MKENYSSSQLIHEGLQGNAFPGLSLKNRAKAMGMLGVYNFSIGVGEAVTKPDLYSAGNIAIGLALIVAIFYEAKERGREILATRNKHE